MMRPFLLHRSEDVSGVSGTGIVAEGIIFSDGRVALAWRGEHSSVGIYNSIADVVRIHGHGRRTRVIYPDRRKGAGYDRLRQRRKPKSP